MKELRIRDARADDRETALAVTLLAYQQYAVYMPELWEMYRQSIIATLTDFKPAEQIIAEQDSVVVGTVLLFPAGTHMTTSDDISVPLKWPEIRLLAVAPDMRGHGVGGALVNECMRRARQSGVEAITLHTTDMMQTAMQMYERMGFIRMPELDFFPAPEITVKGYHFQFDDKPLSSS